MAVEDQIRSMDSSQLRALFEQLELEFDPDAKLEVESEIVSVAPTRDGQHIYARYEYTGYHRVKVFYPDGSRKRAGFWSDKDGHFCLKAERPRGLRTFPKWGE